MADELDVLSAEVMENQRWFPVVGWGKKLLPTDRMWTNANGAPAQAPSGEGAEAFALKQDGKGSSMKEAADASPAPGCQWVGPWQAGEWQYAIDFPRAFHSGKAQPVDCVRRRLWSRPFVFNDPQLLSGQSLTPTGPGGATDGFSTADGAISQPSPATAIASGPGFSGLLTVNGQRGCWGVVDQGQFFILPARGASKADVIIDLVEIEQVSEVHPLEAGVPYAVRVTAKSGVVLLISTSDQESCDLLKKELQGSQGAKLLRSVSRSFKGAAAVGERAVSAGASIAGKHFAATFGSGAGWTIGRRVAAAACRKAGI